MRVLVDTPIWSLVLRRRGGDLSPQDRQVVAALERLAQRGEVELLGLVRQEVLSGIGDENHFRTIRDRLRVFPNTALAAEDFEEAANLSNRCRRKGITGSTVDMLICSVALRHDWEIFSSDRDFIHYRKAIPIRLFVPSA